MRPLWNLLDGKLLKFLGLGLLNTLLSAVLMFGIFNLTRFGYWPASAIAYIAGALFGFVMSKVWVFEDKGNTLNAAIRFFGAVSACYVFSFGISKPLVHWVLAGAGVSPRGIDQLAMGCAMVLYTVANYLLQRLFVFQEAHRSEKVSDSVDGVASFERVENTGR